MNYDISFQYTIKKKVTKSSKQSTAACSFSSAHFLTHLTFSLPFNQSVSSLKVVSQQDSKGMAGQYMNENLDV
ncbi:hypothetical protein PsorP6_012071 [Peronosclerospora sorghi]|uniref:Uncharacterized protein n=1 Tax=Peronosclerospora sorghi TaxID=230839 RepID=A0ACC0WI00_9STRA|nr:hypothetical protein PsorP6_012071 [Peronosclerospora sorghi]